MGTKTGKGVDFVQGGSIPSHIVDPFKVPEVTVYIIGVMFGHSGDLAAVTLKMQGHNLPLVAGNR